MPRPDDPLLVTLTEGQLRELVTEALAEALEGQPPGEPGPDLVSGADLARRLGVSRATVHRLRCRGMPAIRILDTYRFQVAECLAWLRSSNGGGLE